MRIGRVHVEEERCVLWALVQPVEHVVRDEADLERIRRYIVANRAEAEAFVKQFLNLNDKEARLSVAQMVKSFRDTGRTTDEAVVDFIETTLRSTKQKAGSIKPGDIVDWSVTTEVVRELDKEKK